VHLLEQAAVHVELLLLRREAQPAPQQVLRAEQTNPLGCGHIQHERQVGDGRQAGGEAKHGHAEVKDALASGRAADHDERERGGGSPRADLDDGALVHAPFQRPGHDQADQRARPPNSRDARRLLHAEAKGLAREGFEQDILPEDGGQQQDEVDEEQAGLGVGDQSAGDSPPRSAPGFGGGRL